MLIFGDHTELANPAERQGLINDDLSKAFAMPAGIARHSAICGALVEAGRLLQGVADADFRAGQRDTCNGHVQALGDWVLGIARMLCRSWSSNFEDPGDVARASRAAGWPDQVELKKPEGFAFYAVYPEAYADAAARLRLNGQPRVIGIRSIGTSLGAVAAAALGAPEFVTVRPFGDPFARKIAVAPELEARLLDGDPHFVVVDEGPGQSGSSFGAVADWLQERGVPLDRIAFLPSHSGAPGPQASLAQQARWQAAQRAVADLGEQLPRLLASWLAAAGLPLDGPPREISSGAWRSLQDGEWPAVVAMFERRKFLFQSGGMALVARFAGLGRTGEEKLAVARRLRGAVPEAVALVHGFLVEQWHNDAISVPAQDAPLGEIGRYIGTRAALLSGLDGPGASIAELYAMACRNISLAAGEELASRLSDWEPRFAELEHKVSRYPTDNRLDSHEWLRTGEGGLLKADALDHHQAHDLVGCQDLAWDVAGAIAEFDLDTGRADDLIAVVERRARRSVDRQLLAFYDVAYPAFRLGLAAFGADLARGDAAEQARLSSEASRYMAQLQHLLHASGPRLGTKG